MLGLAAAAVGQCRPAAGGGYASRRPGSGRRRDGRNARAARQRQPSPGKPRMADGRMVRDACRVRGQMNGDDRISQRFWFEHQSGKRLYPYKLRDLRSGRVAFRVAPGAAGANKVENQTQIDNEEEDRKSTRLKSSHKCASSMP